jgi:hypothetical protein
MIKYARSLLLQGNDFVVYVASCRLNAYHAQLAASRKTENFEKLQVWDKMRFLLRAHALDRKEERNAAQAVLNLQRRFLEPLAGFSTPILSPTLARLHPPNAASNENIPTFCIGRQAWVHESAATQQHVV